MSEELFVDRVATETCFRLGHKEEQKSSHDLESSTPKAEFSPVGSVKLLGPVKDKRPTNDLGLAKRLANLEHNQKNLATKIDEGFARLTAAIEKLGTAQQRSELAVLD